jgi:hypothetical protein
VGNEQALMEFGHVRSVLRTRRQQDVNAVVHAVFEQVRSQPQIERLFAKYIYATTHHYHPKLQAFAWRKDAESLLAGISHEPRASIGFEGQSPGTKLWLYLNCAEEIVTERVDGKQRKVPKASDSSVVNLGADVRFFIDPSFVEAYLAVLSALFVIMQGEYGYAEHVSLKHGNDYDRLHRNPYEPSFITWANCFGPDLVAQFGRERLRNTPAFAVRELPGGSFMVLTSNSPLRQPMAEAQDRIAQVAAHLNVRSPSARADYANVVAFTAQQAAVEEQIKREVEQRFRELREQTLVQMQRYADGCAMGAQRFWGASLDFTPQSLVRVDLLIASGYGSKESQDTIDTAVQAFGAYVGEVVRRSLGGTWLTEENNGEPILVGVGPARKRVEPFCIVREYLQLDRQNSSDLAAWFGKLQAEH